MAARTGYTLLQIALHWTIALLIIAAFVTREAMHDIERALAAGTPLEGPPAHTIIGGLVFVLVVVRIIVRHRSGAPEPEQDLPAWNRTAAIWGHRLLYALMLAVPALGAMVWYGGIDGLEDLHGTLGLLLIVTALGHALVAIGHEVQGGSTLKRMFQPVASDRE